MRAAPELIVLSASGILQHGPACFSLPKKLYSGLMEFERLWPGRVTLFSGALNYTDLPQSFVRAELAETPFSIEVHEVDEVRFLQRLGNAVVLAPLAQRYVQLFRGDDSIWNRLIWVTETSLLTRLQMLMTEPIGFVRQAKRAVSEVLSELQFRRTISRSAGIQCNGTPTFGDYASIAERPLLFFDTRSRAAMVAGDRQIERRCTRMLNGGRLNLVFSGRLIRIKGVDELLKVAQRVKMAGVDFVLDIFGTGDREAALRRAVEDNGLSEHVRLNGFVDFYAELVPYFCESADLFVCCHPQGDPSCTYLETMACGVPIAGYGNEALAGVVATSGVGWAVPRWNPDALAERIVSLSHERPRLAKAAYHARDFARQHTFEATMARRVRHIESCVGMSCTL